MLCTKPTLDWATLFYRSQPAMDARRERHGKGWRSHETIKGGPLNKIIDRTEPLLRTALVHIRFTWILIAMICKLVLSSNQVP